MQHKYMVYVDHNGTLLLFLLQHFYISLILQIMDMVFFQQIKIYLILVIVNLH